MFHEVGCTSDCPVIQTHDPSFQSDLEAASPFTGRGLWQHACLALAGERATAPGRANPCRNSAGDGLPQCREHGAQEVHGVVPDDQRDH